MPAVLPGEGDIAYPDGAYEILAGEKTIELVGLADVNDVNQVTARAIPSDIVFHVRFKGNEFSSANVIYFLKRFAGYYNTLAELPHVVGAQVYEDITAAGQLRDMMEVTVASTSGVLTTTITETGIGRSLDYMQQQVNAAAANLDAIEASSG
jgi:hypothetical protein